MAKSLSYVGSSDFGVQSRVAVSRARSVATQPIESPCCQWSRDSVGRRGAGKVGPGAEQRWRILQNTAAGLGEFDQFADAGRGEGGGECGDDLAERAVGAAIGGAPGADYLERSEAVRDRADDVDRGIRY